MEWPPSPLSGFTKVVLEAREPLMILEDVAEEAARLGIEVDIIGDAPKSVLFVPLFAGGSPFGVISLQNVDRERAFTETDERLLVTLAGSLSVALEDARPRPRDPAAKRRARADQQRPGGDRGGSSRRRSTTLSATRSATSSTPRPS